MERLIAACTNCAVSKAPCRIKGKICTESGYLIASKCLPRRGSNDAPRAGAAGLRENAPVERLIAACTNCAVSKAPCRIKGKICTESGYLIASKCLPRRGSNDAPRAGAAGLRENAPVERLIAACTNCAVSKAPCRIKGKICTESGYLIASKCLPRREQAPALRLYCGVPEKAEVFLGRGDITECARGGFC